MSSNYLDNKPILLIENVNKIFENGVEALKNLSLQVNRGEIYCMLGANGAGKTTTVNLIFNFINATAGKILVNDIDVSLDPISAKKHMAFVSENVTLYDNFSALQNLDFFSRLAGKSYTKNEYCSILGNVGLPEEAHRRRVGTFSKGMRQKCGIAIAIAKDAELIILDEPTSGLDPKSGREFINILLELKKVGKSILMTTHDIFRAKEMADKVGIMLKGDLVLELNSSQIENIDLEEIYMKYVS